MEIKKMPNISAGHFANLMAGDLSHPIHTTKIHLLYIGIKFFYNKKCPCITTEANTRTKHFHETPILSQIGYIYSYSHIVTYFNCPKKNITISGYAHKPYPIRCAIYRHYCVYLMHFRVERRIG